MALTKEEEGELKILFNFPLIFKIGNDSIEIRNKNFSFLVFTSKARNNTKFQKIMFDIINDRNVKLNLKNVKFNFKDNNYFTMNGERIFSIHSVTNFEGISTFGFDFIKAQRINRIYREYILDRMNKAFNNNS